MDIRSTPSGVSSQTHAGRTRESNADPVNRQGVPPRTPAENPRIDRVELSDAARELHAQLGAPADATGLAPQRMQELTGRMRSGYYDRADVVQRILDRVIAGDPGTDSRG